MSVRRRIILATSNPHKVEELQAALRGATEAEVVGLEAYANPSDIEESACSFEGNARLKAHGIAAWLVEHREPGETWVLADDSGLCVEALDGQPGIRSARFSGPRANDASNNQALCDALLARGLRESPGRYVCVLVLVRVDGQRFGAAQAGSALVFSADWPVTVRVESRGTGGFGYDPHAWLGPQGPTVAELAAEAKAIASHRGQALAQLLVWLRGQ